MIPVAVPTFLLTQIDYSFLWRYVGWTNQLVATVMLWTAAVYLVKQQKSHWMSSIPALFMTGVVSTYIFYAPEGFRSEERRVGKECRLSCCTTYSEDFIRNLNVTGVQTCALPISD